VKLRPLSEQVIVITGASSGIGLVTARMAASRGATVVLAARNEEARLWPTFAPGSPVNRVAC
jgi:NAD(P)-dependent dehydrogenase (short-subunit alcohol dehydrogenase family)